MIHIIHFTASKVGGACSHLGSIGPKVGGALAPLALWLLRPWLSYAMLAVSGPAVSVSTMVEWLCSYELIYRYSSHFPLWLSTHRSKPHYTNSSQIYQYMCTDTTWTSDYHTKPSETSLPCQTIGLVQPSRLLTIKILTNVGASATRTSNLCNAGSAADMWNENWLATTVMALQCQRWLVAAWNDRWTWRSQWWRTLIQIQVYAPSNAGSKRHFNSVF